MQAIFERQPAMIKNSPYLALEISNRIFIMHVQNFARQHLVPVLHYLVIVSIVVREFLNVVSECLAASEELFIATKTTVQRMSARIDDCCVRQYQVQQSDQWEIIWQFVGEIGFVSEPVATCVLDVLLPQCFPVATLEILCRVWKVHAV